MLLLGLVNGGEKGGTVALPPPSSVYVEQPQHCWPCAVVSWQASQEGMCFGLSFLAGMEAERGRLPAIQP